MQEKSCNQGRAPHHTKTPLSLTHAHTKDSDLWACQCTKRFLCPLITLVQPSLQEAVSLTSPAHGRSPELGAERRTMHSVLEERRTVHRGTSNEIRISPATTPLLFFLYFLFFTSPHDVSFPSCRHLSRNSSISESKERRAAASQGKKQKYIYKPNPLPKTKGTLHKPWNWRRICFLFPVYRQSRDLDVKQSFGLKWESALNHLAFCIWERQISRAKKQRKKW